MSDIKPSVYYAARCLQMVLQEMPGMAEYAYGELLAVIEREIEGRDGKIDIELCGRAWTNRFDGDIGDWPAVMVSATVCVGFSAVGSIVASYVSLTVEADGARCKACTESSESLYDGPLDEAVRRFVKVLR